MARLRKRRWAKKRKVVDPLSYVFRLFYEAIPEFKRYRVGKIESYKNGKTVRGRIKGRYNADFELDIWKDETDFIVKINLFTMRGRSVGETYRISIVRAEKVVPKFAILVQDFLSRIRSGDIQ